MLLGYKGKCPRLGDRVFVADGAMNVRNISQIRGTKTVSQSDV